MMSASIIRSLIRRPSAAASTGSRSIEMNASIIRSLICPQSATASTGSRLIKMNASIIRQPPSATASTGSRLIEMNASIIRQPSSATASTGSRSIEMNASIIRSLIRPQSATASTFQMFHRRLLGTTIRSDHEGEEEKEEEEIKNCDNKQVKFVATLTLGGLDASEVESVVPLVQQHLDLAGFKAALFKHLVSHLPRKLHSRKVDIGCHAEATMDGFEDSELETLRPCVDQYLSTAPLDRDKEINYFANIKGWALEVHEKPTLT